MTRQDGGTRLAEELSGLFTRSVQGNLEVLRRVAALAKEGAAGFSSGTGERRLPASGDLLNRLIEWNVAYYSAWTNHSLGLLNDLTSAAEKALRVPSTCAGEAEAGEAARVEVHLAARAGELASASFVVANHLEETVAFALQAGEIKGRTGAVVCAQPGFTPAQLTLQPKSQAVIQVSVELTPQFEPGETYLLPIRLGGPGGKVIWAGIETLPPAEPPSATKQ